MKFQASRPSLSRFVAAARSDVPSAAEFERAFGDLPAATRGSRSAADAGTPAVSTLAQVQRVKLGLAGLVLLVAAGAVVVGRSLGRVREPRAVAHASGSSVAPQQPPETQAPAPVSASVASQPEPSPPPAAKRGRGRHAAQTGAPAGTLRPRASAESQPPAVSLQPTAASIAAESTLIEAARRALHSDPARALELAAEHARSFETGLLRLEGEALAIHALALLGREREARVRLDELQRAHPRSIHVTRLRRVLGYDAALSGQ